MVEMPTQSAARRPPARPPVEGPAHRTVGFLLGVGVLLLPGLFAWFMLRRGYSTFARIVAFGWLIFGMVISIGLAGSSEPEVAPAPAAKIPTSAPPAAKVIETDADKVWRFPADYLELSPAGGALAGPSDSFVLDGDLINTSAFVIKKPQLSCFIYGGDGKVAAAARLSLRMPVPARGSRPLGERRVKLDHAVPMARYQCSVIEAEAVIP